MMPQQNFKAIVELINQSSYAYSVFTEMSNANTDYADFISLSFRDFKKVLNTPEMTQRQLRRIVRQAHTNHRNTDPEGCWATFLAGYLGGAANQQGKPRT